jgi:hypothetical protein
MNFLKKGPELKRPEMKIPDFLYDLFYDLKDRHLLPVVALLIAAIIAMPIILKSKSSEAEAEVAPISASASGGEESLVVAHSTPGLRDPSRRLSHRHAVDPFSQKGASKSSSEGTEEVSGGPSAPSEAAPVEATGIGIETETPVESVITPEPSIEYPTESSSSRPGPTKTRYANDSIDVRIVAVPGQSPQAAKKKPQAEVRRNLPELTMLPNRSTPAATFMGLSRDGKKVLLVVSSDVVSIFGEGTCVIGSKSCQLLALEAGMPETFVYGPQERRYRIEVLKIEKELSAKPRRAALGATSPKAGSPAEEAEGAGSSGTEGSPAPAERGGGGSTAG